MIIIVDDDEQIYEALSYWLKLINIRSTHYFSGEQLFQSLSKNIKGELIINDPKNLSSSIAISGVILDLNLIGMNGLEISRKLRKIHNNIPIVIITAIPPKEVECKEDIPYDIKILGKPFDLDELESLLFSD